MEKKSYLLPHSWQKIGWWLLGASAVGVSILIVFEIIGRLKNWGEVVIPELPSLIMVTLVTCVPFLGLLLICLSQEKQEDEFIQCLRSRPLFIVVVYAFVIQMISISLDQFLMAYIPTETLGQLKSIIHYCTNIPLMAVFYLAIFKGMMFVNYLRSKKDGE